MRGMPLGGEEGAGPLLNQGARKPTRRSELYPGLLTIILACLFGAPVVTGITIASDPTVEYWIGRIGYAVIAIPFILVICHIVQAYTGRPMFFPILFSVVGPGLIIIVVGFQHTLPVGSITSRLTSTDCITFTEKFRVEDAYRSARRLYDNCVAASLANSTQPVPSNATATSDILVQSCPDYNEQGEFGREWTYLRRMETEGDCSGWCNNGETALWTKNDQNRDSCAMAAGAILMHKILPFAERMAFVGVVGFVAGMAIIVALELSIHRAQGQGKEVPW